MDRRIVAIVNPASGRGGVASLISRVAHDLRRRGIRFEPHLTEYPEHATRLARECPDSTEAVLVVGGDGTVCEVINGLIGRDVPVVILGTGTENLISRELGMPSEADGVTRTLLEGEPFAMDVGLITTGGGRVERRFLAVAGFGFDAECIVRMSGARRGNITHADYFWPVWRTFWLHRFPVLRVEVDGALVFEDRGFVLVGNIGRYSLGLRPLARASFDDGRLDVCAVPCTSRRSLVGYAWKILLAQHLECEEVLYRQCKRVRITSPDAVPIEIDGEVGGLLPAELEILPGAARFKRPK